MSDDLLMVSVTGFRGWTKTLILPGGRKGGGRGEEGGGAGGEEIENL